MDIEKHLFCSTKYHKEFEALLKPLFKYSKVGFFSYNRFYRDKKWTGLYTDTLPVANDLDAGGGPLFVDSSGINIDNGYYIHSDLQQLLKINVDHKQVDRFFSQNNSEIGKQVVQNGLLIVRKGLFYDESFYFSLMQNPIQDRLYFNNNMEIIKKFCHYFLFRGKSLIAQIEKYKTDLKIPNDVSDLLVENKNGLVEELSTKKFCFQTPLGDVFLSMQELRCLKLLADGLQQREIADNLSLESKTVESYLRSVKNKLNCDSRAELAKYYRYFEILDCT